MPPEFWIEHGVSKIDLKPFMPPSFESLMANKTKIHFYGYYKCWDPQENYYYCRENCGFEPNTERSEGTYSKYASLDDKIDGYHYFLGVVKFGIGRATSDAAHEIRDGKITRGLMSNFLKNITLISLNIAIFQTKIFNKCLIVGGQTIFGKRRLTAGP